ncbi:MAG: hypothetical protein ACKO96_39450 [Flammeovirgaceae bacterium]
MVKSAYSAKFLVHSSDYSNFLKVFYMVCSISRQWVSAVSNIRLTAFLKFNIKVTYSRGLPIFEFISLPFSINASPNTLHTKDMLPSYMYLNIEK